MTGTATGPERRAADAYPEMARLLGDKWFLTPPPAEGVEVTVLGRDLVHTVWAMSADTAARLRPHVDNNPALRWVSCHPYYARRAT